MSYFHGAQGVTVEGDVIAINANNYIHHSSSSSSTSSIEKLREHIAPGAMHDSAERWDAPKCHPETRVAVQGEIVSWILHGDDEEEPKKILWVTGPAGGGKTAIMGSTGDTCEEKGLLACCFFFSLFAGSANRRSKRCLVATLAYQLAQHDALRSVGERILSCVERNPAIFDRQLKVQLDQLLLQPLRECRRDPDAPSWPKVILIDGLDECQAEQYGDIERSPQEVARSNEVDQKEILHALLKAADDPSFPFRIIVASRPEPVIESFFTDLAQHTTKRIFLDDKYNPDADMLLFLNSRFADIRYRYQLSVSWPSENVKQTLVQNGSGQFIYVATVMRFLDGGSAPPHELLDRVMTLRRQDGRSNPFAPLDALYAHIINSTPNPTLTSCWLFFIFLRASGRALDQQWTKLQYPARFLQLFLESSPGEASYVLRGLNSLISVPPTDDNTSPFSLFHKSLTDFLADSSRCGSLHSQYPRIRALYCSRYLQIWKNKGPATPLSEPERGRFLHQFLELQLYSLATIEEPDFDSCDVSWWVRSQVESSRLLDCKDSLFHLENIRFFFHLVHAKCNWYRRCCPACKNIRKEIVEELRKLDLKISSRSQSGWVQVADWGRYFKDSIKRL